MQTAHTPNRLAEQALAKTRSKVVIMGVAGCGKSSLAADLSQHLSWTMIEGDLLHSERNRERMRAGIALTDQDRQGWLESLGQLISSSEDEAVLTCSALKKRYRDILRKSSMNLRFVFLDIAPAVSLQRVQARSEGHFFSPGLVDSQFEALERPDGEAGTLCLDASLPIPELRQLVVDWI